MYNKAVEIYRLIKRIQAHTVFNKTIDILNMDMKTSRRQKADIHSVHVSYRLSMKQ